MAKNTEKIGKCVVCGGDIVEKLRYPGRFSDFSATLANELMAFCSGCGILYDPDTIRKLSQNKVESTG